jgi:hypothetical protein
MAPNRGGASRGYDWSAALEACRQNREVTMAKKAVKAARIVEGGGLRWPPVLCAYTDPAVVGVDAEVMATLDAPTKKKVLAATHEGKAAVHKTLAEANTNIANILKSGG